MKKNLKDKKSLNIAMLGHKRIPSREGGIEIVVEELATRMVTLGHKVTCYNRSGHHVSGKNFDGGKRKAYKGVRLKSVLTLDKKGLAAMTASVSGAICAAFGKYDVVHFHAEGPCAMLWLPKLFGKRCVATVHGLDHQRAKWGKLASTYIMMGEKCAVKYADEIIVLSKGVQDYFKETYGRETKFIPNGVNRPVIRKPELIKEKFGLEKDDYLDPPYNERNYAAYYHLPETIATGCVPIPKGKSGIYRANKYLSAFNKKDIATKAFEKIVRNASCKCLSLIHI